MVIKTLASLVVVLDESMNLHFGPHQLRQYRQYRVPCGSFDESAATDGKTPSCKLGDESYHWALVLSDSTGACS